MTRLDHRECWTAQGTPTIYSDGFRPLDPFTSCLVHPWRCKCERGWPAGLGEKTPATHKDGVYLTKLIGIRERGQVTKILCDRLNLWQPELIVEATVAAMPGGPPHPAHLRSVTASQATTKRAEQEPNVHHF